MSLPFLSFDHKVVLSSDDILQLEQLPNNLAIIGGGVIGLEFASLMTDFGVDVTVIEAGARILPTESKAIAKTLRKELTDRGVAFYENTQLSESDITVDKDHINIKLNDEIVQFEKALISIGRLPNTDDIGLNNTKIQLTDKSILLLMNTNKPTINISMQRVIVSVIYNLRMLALKKALSQLNICLISHHFQLTIIKCPNAFILNLKWQVLD